MIDWKAERINKAIDRNAVREVEEKYRPSMTRQYVENGRTIRVFEARTASGVDLKGRINW